MGQKHLRQEVAIKIRKERPELLQWLVCVVQHTYMGHLLLKVEIPVFPATHIR